MKFYPYRSEGSVSSILYNDLYDAYNELVRSNGGHFQDQQKTADNFTEEKQAISNILDGNDILNFPKWRYRKIKDVLIIDPAYLVWMHEKGHINLSLILYREAQRRSYCP